MLIYSTCTCIDCIPILNVSRIKSYAVIWVLSYEWPKTIPDILSNGKNLTIQHNLKCHISHTRCKISLQFHRNQEMIECSQGIIILPSISHFIPGFLNKFKCQTSGYPLKTWSTQIQSHSSLDKSHVILENQALS